MLEKYKHFINSNLSDTKNQKLLLAVSGGVDSMVMLDLSRKSDLDISVAHVNHGVRGKSSDKDALLVEQICKQFQIPYFEYKFSQEQKSTKNFQENARNIRYNWMNALCDKHGFSFILTAHHRADSVETFFINLMRGAGLSGLTGIPPLNQNKLRPLSNFNKEEILQFAADNSIQYREDESNKETKYLRNLIRNEWLPYLSKNGIQAEKMISQSLSNLRRDRSLLRQLVENKMNTILSKDSQGNLIIDIGSYSVDNHDFTVDLLYNYLKNFDFTYDNVQKCVIAETGSVFCSRSHELLKNREQLILRPLSNISPINLSITNYGDYEFEHLNISVSNKEDINSFQVNDLVFPFTIRTWNNGDRFQPHGMNGASKKVKDFLTDLKLDRWTKNATLVIEKDNKIIAIIPHRVSHGYGSSVSNAKIFMTVEYM